MTFQHFDSEWREYIDLEADSSVCHKDKLKVIVTPLLVTPATIDYAEAALVSQYVTLESNLNSLRNSLVRNFRSLSAESGIFKSLLPSLSSISGSPWNREPEKDAESASQTGEHVQQP